MATNTQKATAAGSVESELAAGATACEQFSEQERSFFVDNGYVIQRGLIPVDYLQQMRRITERDLAGHLGDNEYEADLPYPGAPASLESEGGRTIRRLRQAISRDPIFLKLLKEPFLLQRLCQLLGEEGLSIKEAAERLRIPRGTLYEEIKRVRRIFDQQGLGNYLKD